MFSGLVVAITLIASSATLIQAQPAPTVHPALLFGAEDIPLLKERIQRAPYDAWWQTVLTRSQNGLPTAAEERTKARLAKSMAFVYLMTDDESWAQQALTIMRDTKFPPQGGDMGQPHNEGELVAHYALAYDMLHNYAAANDTVALGEIRAILVAEAARLEKGIVIQEVDLGLISLKVRLHETPHIDNWHIRAYGGLGLAALALRDHADASTWAERALDLVTRSLDFQIEKTNGGYAEGPFYSRYAADVYLPYFVALKRIEGNDLFASVKALHEWSFNLRMPNGRRPNIDDGHVDDFYGHYLASIAENGGEYRWDWENNSSGLYVRQFSETDAIALFDDRVEAVMPTREASVFMPGAGDAVFRSDWSEQATYMLFRGENGIARTKGLSHEHPDETSFIVYAAGEMLALDAGYINFTNHGKINKGSNHNVVLVDGEGPPLFTLAGESIGGGNDAFIEDTFISANGDYAEVRAEYQKVGMRRRVFFVGKEYFLISDQMSAEDEHEYEWRLHGNGGGSSGGAYVREGNLARWTRENGELIAYLPEREGRVFAEIDTLHSFDAGQELMHTTLQVQQRGSSSHFLAALFPRATGGDIPVFETLATHGGEGIGIRLGAGGSIVDIAWVKDASAETAATSGYLSDGAFGWIRAGEGTLSYIVQDGTHLSDAILSDPETPIFIANAALDLSLSTSLESIAGYVRGPGTGYELMLPIGKEMALASISFGGEVLSTSEVDGLLTLSLAGQGEIDITLAVREEAAPEPLFLRSADLVGEFGPYLAQNGRERLFITFQNGLSAHIPERAAQGRATNICKLNGRAEATYWLAMPSLSLTEPTLTQVTDTGLEIRNTRAQLEVNSRGRQLGPNKFFSITCGTEPFAASKRMAQQQVSAFGFDAPYPNPFNSEVVIRFSIPQATATSVVIYNMAGQKMRTLEAGYLESGSYRFAWDGLNDSGHSVATGIYFVRLQAGVQSRVQKITLLR
jgi:hypothetical protein